MGVGEGVTYPSIQNLARKWVPEQKRSRALAFIYSGARRPASARPMSARPTLPCLPACLGAAGRPARPLLRGARSCGACRWQPA